MMQLAIARPAPTNEPTERDLAAYLASHAAEFAAPATIRMAHVYLGARAHGDALATDAARLLDTLRQTEAGPESAATLGDPFIRGATLGPMSATDVERVFGSAFARAIEDAPVRTWIGPVRSSYGLHIVWIQERVPSRVPDLSEVRGRVLRALLDEGGAARTEERTRLLRARYDVSVEH
jgi:hypothetical protein